MRAHLEKRGDNYFRIVIEFDPENTPDGLKRNRKYFYFKGGPKAAREEMDRLKALYERGITLDAKKLTVGEYLTWWLDVHSKSKDLAPKTIDTYTDILKKHLIPALGHIRLLKLTPMHVQNYVVEKNEEKKVIREGEEKKEVKAFSPRTVSYSLMVLRLALKHAVNKYRLIPFNPAAGADAPSYSRVKYRVMTEAELSRFLDFAENDKYYPLIYTALFTGMRRGELFGLRWKDVDLDNQKACVRQTVQRLPGRGFIIKEPKTEAGQREIDLPTTVVALLRQVKDQQDKRREEAEKQKAEDPGAPPYEDNDLVFCYDDGRNIDPSYFSHRFNRLVKKAGLPGLRFHDLRHTHISLLLDAGEQLEVVRQRAGHNRASTTADIYGHPLPGRQKKAAEKFDEKFGRQTGDKIPLEDFPEDRVGGGD